MNITIRTVRCLSIACAILVLLRFSAGAAALPFGYYPLRGQYTGVLPCSDCPGVWTELTLVDPGPDLGLGRGTFVMTERFTGGRHGGAVVATQGTWSTLERLSLAGTLELQSASWTAPRYFSYVGGLSLEPLDDRRQPISGVSMLHHLRRVIPPTRMEFGPLLAATSGTTVVARVGDRFDVALATSGPSDSPDSWSIARTTSPSVTLDQKYGSSLAGLTGTYSIFVLKAIEPGAASVTFRNRKGSQTVTFSFRVEP
ncbi:MAG TPA: copper resistance protein NlpE N-terminal domain-containing protein [Candidatus Baltobacteraceae bacterium]|nr:copper resistance protein NlpE N-terminal domain-containing protein [Candidatus Baltobacteraceae bacterium]